MLHQNVAPNNIFVILHLHLSMQTYCSIAFEITTSNKESKQNMGRAKPL